MKTNNQPVDIKPDFTTKALKPYAPFDFKDEPALSAALLIIVLLVLGLFSIGVFLAMQPAFPAQKVIYKECPHHDYQNETVPTFSNNHRRFWLQDSIDE